MSVANLVQQIGKFSAVHTHIPTSRHFEIHTDTNFVKKTCLSLVYIFYSKHNISTTTETKIIYDL